MIQHDGDRQVLESLKNYGSDLSKSHHIIFYFYFKSKSSAQAAAQSLEKEGCTIQRIDPSPSSTWWQRIFGGAEWSCIVEKMMVPDEKEVFRTTDVFNAIAAKYGGQYDGWEAGIVRSP